jgi:hypothetical protein
MSFTHAWRLVPATMVLSTALGTIGCSMSALSTGAQATSRDARPAAMTVEAQRVPAPATDSDEPELVMAQVRVTDAAGTVLTAPRVFAKIGEPALVQIGSDMDMTEVRITSRRIGTDVVVDAELTCTDGPERITASVKAREAA